MMNFNPIFNQFGMSRMASPFATAGSSIATKAAYTGGLLAKTGRSKITLSGILNGAQKTIGTVNQIVPLYNQIKPMFENSKILLNVAKGLKGSNTRPRRFSNNKQMHMPSYQDNVVQVKKEEKIQDDSPIKREERSNNGIEPSKPFFI